ncbi:MAG TPA: hypothetical protein VMH86_09420 [Rhizomicrobium sp.]|nr:hypothetical protein [Rhizomicrobium sp.]
MRLSVLIVIAMASPAPAAVEAGFDGYADFRLVSPGGGASWLDGGPGKLRHGKGDGAPQYAALFGQGYVRFDPGWTLEPRDWVRLTLDGISVASTRAGRAFEGRDPRQTANQLQLSMRFYLQ